MLSEDHDEEDVSTQQSQAAEQARFSGTHGDGEWTTRVEREAAARAKATRGLGRRNETPQMSQGARSGHRAREFGAQTRLRRAQDFALVLRHGKKKRLGLLTVHWRESEGRSRVGLIVRRGPGKSVERNRIRRQLREGFRAAVVCGEFPDTGVDVVLRMNRAAGDQKWAWLSCREGLREVGRSLRT